MSNDNLSNLTLTLNQLDNIYRKLWSMKSIIGLLESHLLDGEEEVNLLPACFVLVDLVTNIEALLPEM